MRYACVGTSLQERIGGVSVKSSVRLTEVQTGSGLAYVMFVCFYFVFWQNFFLRNSQVPRSEVKRGSLSINALRACVYIYIRQLGSFRAPTLWLIDLTLPSSFPGSFPYPGGDIQYTFLSSFFLYVNFFHEKTRKYSKSPPFSYGIKMAADSYQARKALILREAGLGLG